jgi:hypothetical protein
MRERMLGTLGAPILGVSLALLLPGCTGAPRQAFDSGNRDRLEILTGYTLALSKRDFESAAAMLAPADRERLLGEDGRVRPEYQDRLRAMRQSTLVSNPLVAIEQGRIRGIYDLLPVIEQGEPASVSVIADAPASAPVRELEEEPGREELRAAASAFFRSIRSRNYRKALGMVSPGERGAFLREDGKVREGARRRLAAIDTTAWDALALDRGKLTGVVLIIPSRPPRSGAEGYH